LRAYEGTVLMPDGTSKSLGTFSIVRNAPRSR
jgi:hypothetical protein